MDYQARQALYRQIEKERRTKVLTFVTSDRQGMETVIAQDCIDLFVDLLDQVGPTKKISLVLHTNGGSTLAAWRLVNLIRTFCDVLEVLIPLKALSAGTLISIGSDLLVMTKQSALGPIDPSVNNHLNPQVNIGGQLLRVPVSVESVRGYLDAARNDLGLKGQPAMASVLTHLSQQVHPLVLGEIFRSRAQIRFLAGKLIKNQVKDQKKHKALIDFLCADSGSHDYTINRREAVEHGLNVEKPSENFYRILRHIHLSYAEELKLLQPYSQQVVVGANPTANYSESRGLVESTDGGCYGFVSEGTLTKAQIQTPVGLQEAISDQRTFEGWRKIH
ncbi:SDH family Clp fold serine proteinase [Bradyrhizobium sp. UFLA05-112]